MKKLIQLKLKVLSKMILGKYKPKIIGVTGSVGKTSAKDAIYTVMSAKYNTRRNIENYNNEIGLPLTIIGVRSPGKDIFGWIWTFLKGVKIILFRDKNYPEVLVLEMGVDRPGDMKYLTDIVKPDIGVITLIGPSHLEFFGDIKEIQREKATLIENLKKGGWAISNFDNELSKEVLEKSKAKVLNYGFDTKAKVRAQELVFSFENGDNKEIDNLSGISFKLTYDGSTVPVFLPDVIGYSVVYAALAASSVGIANGMNLVDISKALSKLKSPKGRMTLIDGIKKTMLIDDTYNSSPQSVKLALDVMEKIPVNEDARKFAVLGDMLELGNYSEKGHLEVGEYLVKKGINKLITVGEKARDIDRGAEKVGMKRDDIFNFKNSEEAGKFLQNRMRKGDLILIKGSQGIRMEKIVKEVMAEPLLAKNLLVRQGDEWCYKQSKQ